MEKMARDVRDQFMNVVKDKKALTEEIAGVHAEGACQRALCNSKETHCHKRPTLFFERDALT